MDDGSRLLILEVHKKQNIGAMRLGNIIEKSPLLLPVGNFKVSILFLDGPLICHEFGIESLIAIYYTQDTNAQDHAIELSRPRFKISNPPTQNARSLEKEHGVHIPYNAIHKVLLENGSASEDKRKEKRRKPWIRYERDHSLTLVHLDLHTSDANGKEVCVVLDGSSSMIIPGGEFDAATAQSSIALVNEALQKWGHQED